MKRKGSNAPPPRMTRRQVGRMVLAMADNYHLHCRYDDPCLAAARYILGYGRTPPWKVKYTR